RRTLARIREAINNQRIAAACGTSVYYARCRGLGMSHGQALKAVARKKLKVIYVTIRDKAPTPPSPHD
ncbi:hypothetical protein, partial [Slackia isoflavoniconvertens]|uniref:hypothetical protein n=1 Tax=Slackia isoflavoniconvertens TaxID=572010 RepID=UPI003FD6E68D